MGNIVTDVNADHAVGCLHHVEVDCVVDISEEHTASIIRTEVRSAGSTLTMTHSESLKSVII
jgi:hypothetical protein